MSTPASTADELARLGAIELAGRIARREVSAREAVEAALARIGAVNPKVSAVRVVLADEALAEAGELGHWEIVHKMGETVDDSQVTELAAWAVEVQQRHFDTARQSSLRLAEAEVRG